MDLSFYIIISLGALAGGFVNGLVGFGTAITALGIWLYVLSPTAAATLVIVCSIVSNIQTLPKIINSINLTQAKPWIVSGLIGVPLGTMLLSYVDLQTMKLALGFFLIVYCLYSLSFPTPQKAIQSARIADNTVGFLGGILGGLAGLSGILPAIWGDKHGWSKTKKRSTYQAFNLSILLAAFITHLLFGYITKDVIIYSIIALPGTVVGAGIGVWLYSRLPDIKFKQIILLLLLTSGCTLVLFNV